VKVHHTDNGGEFRSAIENMHKHDIEWQQTHDESPQANGTVAHANQILIEIARAML
ncbi:hypothetical protein LPJ81_005685, partial [Coemansia sp. IMI 209127]